jgi:hypothetical protein
MCQAGSYTEVNDDIEVDGVNFIKTEGGKKIVFITKDDLAKPKVKAVAERGERLYSHTAIRDGLGIKGTEKQADISDPDTMPVEMVKAVRNSKFVGIFIAPSILSDKGQTLFDKAKTKIAGLKKDPKNGKEYAITEEFWKIFNASSANRVENWA